MQLKIYYMASNVKYQAGPDNTTDVRYRVAILQKNYEGEILPMEPAGIPIKRGWQLDKTKAAH